MSGGGFVLSDEDREALGCRCPRVQGDRRHHSLDCKATAVEAIAQRAITAALNDAADAIEGERRSLDKAGHISFATGCYRAERLIRARANPTTSPTDA